MGRLQANPINYTQGQSVKSIDRSTEFAEHVPTDQRRHCLCESHLVSHLVQKPHGRYPRSLVAHHLTHLGPSARIWMERIRQSFALKYKYKSERKRSAGLKLERAKNYRSLTRMCVYWNRSALRITFHSLDKQCEN